MRDLLFLTPLARFADLGLFALRAVTGAFLIYQSHDNVVSTARMQAFVDFCRQAGIPAAEIAAPLSVYAQFICGILYVLGLLTRWAGWVTAVNFTVACLYVHWSQDFPGWWPALILVVLGVYFGTRGAGALSLDARIARR